MFYINILLVLLQSVGPIAARVGARADVPDLGYAGVAICII